MVSNYLSASVTLQTDDAPNLLAKEELNLLARLMGSMQAENPTRAETVFRINLFATDQEEEQPWVPFGSLLKLCKGTNFKSDFYLGNRQTSQGADDSMFGVINIQATQVGWWFKHDSITLK